MLNKLTGTEYPYYKSMKLHKEANTSDVLLHNYFKKTFA